MITFPNSLRHTKGTLLLMDPETGIITFMINLSHLTRSLKVQGAGGEGGDCSEAMRLTGLPVEAIEPEAELDETIQRNQAGPILAVVIKEVFGERERCIPSCKPLNLAFLFTCQANDL